MKEFIVNQVDCWKHSLLTRSWVDEGILGQAEALLMKVGLFIHA